MSELIIVGDRVLIEPHEGEQQTAAGLVLPATVTEKERVGSGRVIRVGPGYLMANPEYSEGEPWSEPKEVVRYLPLQARYTGTVRVRHGDQHRWPLPGAYPHLLLP